MARRTSPSRPAWEDRFSTPSAVALLAELEDEAAALMRTARDVLRQEGDCTETVTWRGLPWRWTLSYRTAGSRSDHDPAAFLVLNPAAPTIVVRLSGTEFTDLPVRKLSRYIREGLAQAKLVAGVAWPEWTVQSQGNLSDVLDLFRLIRQSTLAGA